MWPHTLTEIDENPFLSIVLPSFTILPLLQKVRDRSPDTFITALWNQGGHTTILKRNTTIGYEREVDYIEIPIIEWQYHTAEVIEISHEKLPHKKCAFMFQHTFHQKHKIDLEYAKISQQTK